MALDCLHDCYSVASFLYTCEVNCRLYPAPVSDADEAVELHLTTKPSLKCKGEYAKFIPKQQANIACYACMRGNKAAIRHFSKTATAKVLTGLPHSL